MKLEQLLCRCIRLALQICFARLMICLVVIGLDSCQRPTTTKPRDDADLIAEIIENLPPWNRPTLKDEMAVTRLLSSLEQLSVHETPVLRKGIERFVSQQYASGDYSVDDMGKLYLLNRYLFKAPSRLDISTYRSFGGFMGIPHDDDDWVDMLWPFSVTASGKLIPQGLYIAYTGPPYAAIEEFDYLNEKFGRR